MTQRIRLLSYPDLKAEKGIPYSRVHLLRLEKAGKFPRRIRLGKSTIAWVEREIDAMLLEKMAERSSAEKRRESKEPVVPVHVRVRRMD